MPLIEENYKVLPGKMITGKHRVYKAGEFLPASESCGDMAAAIKDGIVEKIAVEDLAAAKELAAEEAKSPKAAAAKKSGAGRPKKDAPE